MMMMMIVSSGLVVRRAEDLRVRHLQSLQSCHLFGRRARFEVPVLVIVVLLLFARAACTRVLLPSVVPRSRCRRIYVVVPCTRVLVLGRVERLESPSASTVGLRRHEFRIRRGDDVRRSRSIVVMRSFGRVLFRRRLFTHTQVNRHVVHPAACVFAIGLLFCTDAGFVVVGLLIVLDTGWAASRLHSAEDRFRNH